MGCPAVASIKRTKLKELVSMCSAPGRLCRVCSSAAAIYPWSPSQFHVGAGHAIALSATGARDESLSFKAQADCTLFWSPAFGHKYYSFEDSPTLMVSYH